MRRLEEWICETIVCCPRATTVSVAVLKPEVKSDRAIDAICCEVIVSGNRNAFPIGRVHNA
jgi:hypothetical protein